MKVSEIKFNEFAYKNMVSSYQIFGKFSPAIFKREKGYGIRIKTGSSWRGDRKSDSYDYFTLEEDGLITISPRGEAKRFNKKVRITDISDMVEKYKLRRINE